MGNFARFSPDSESLYVTNIDDGAGNVWTIDPESKAGRAVTDLEGRPGGLGQIALATDGDYIYFTWMVNISDIWVADMVDEEKRSPSSLAHRANNAFLFLSLRLCNAFSNRSRTFES